MSHLFRFPTAVRRDSAIEDWMRAQPGELAAIAQRWFDALRACGDDVRELLHDGHHVNVGFFRGAELADPEGLMEGTGKLMRHVKLTPGRHVDASALGQLIDTAYSDMKRRVTAE